MKTGNTTRSAKAPNTKTRNTVISAFALTLVALVGLKLFVIKQPLSVRADEDPPDSISIRGAVRDFRSDHPDFNLTDPAVMGHCVPNVKDTLNPSWRPVWVGSGKAVTEQWYDKDGNPIRPYVSYDDPGLPGGHFDVDVFDEATDKELYHEHQFDDKFDVTYVDIAHDEKLLWDEVIGPGYPNDLRVEFVNPHHGSGTYTFQAGGPVVSGNTRDGFEATFNPNTLNNFRITFQWLLELRGTKPGTVQGDVVDRDDALSIRMYDVTTNALVYELAVYHHISGDADEFEMPDPVSDGEDACGNAIDDDLGTLGDACGGAVTSVSTFDQWFRDVMGTNLSKPHTFTLNRNADGVYEYLEDDFYPIDGRLLGNEGDEHNNFFTYSIAATFTYHECTGQFFEFEGNDDCWVFIDNTPAIDIGGANTPSKQYVALDRLELEDGEQYRFDFFFAHRRKTMDSLFRVRTNIQLATDGPVPVGGTYD